MDRRWPISDGSSQGREKEEEREKKREKNIESVDPSPTGDFFSLCREKKHLLAWGEGTRRPVCLGHIAEYASNVSNSFRSFSVILTTEDPRRRPCDRRQEVDQGFGVCVRSQRPRRVAGEKESLPSVRGLHVGTAHPEGSDSCPALLIGCVLPESMGPAAQH
ncbi:hypothetical protein B296_00018109 [Ensete ventricosum]|uniref:Uncharacterized protein n=1 Tax=Ensete ventricosum TaxID=4639 RepID=A0A427AUF0_ENSVE|nr:hypothetical protein B296_00018109 [Ensete ventricosum]